VIDTKSIPTQASRKLYSSGNNRLVVFVQRLFYWPFRLISLSMLRQRRVELSPADIVPGQQYVIAANHQTHVDPFVVISLIPPDVKGKLGVIRAFAHTVFFSNILNRTFMTIFGAFPTKAHPILPHGLDFARDLLQDGQVVLIFPEGRMTIPGETPAKRGVGIMAQWPDVMVIPIRMDWHRHGRFGRTLNLGVGKPFDGHGMTAQEILDRVFDLPTR
jgi:1-acyl-sn-glycerol-3-phosphate acyltransferase